MMRLLIVLPFAAAACGPDRGYVSRDAIAPSVNAVADRHDDFVEQALARGDITPQRADAWVGETALLRALVADDPAAPVPLPD